MPNRRWIAGYVWRGGFTIYRLTVWNNSFRAMGTGALSSDRGVTYIHFRVGSNRFGIYALAVFGVLFVLAGVGILASVARGSTQLPFGVIGVVFMAIPVALFISGGRSLRHDGRRSEEADRLLEIVADVIGAEELPLRGSRPA
jgi:hypothetical protein